MVKMKAISARELAQIRADAARAVCDLPCEIWRNVRTPEPGGGASPVLTKISPDGLLAGMSQPSASLLQNYGYVVGSQATWQVQFVYGTNVAEKDELRISGKRLTVAKVLTPQSYDALVSVLAAEI